MDSRRFSRMLSMGWPIGTVVMCASSSARSGPYAVMLMVVSVGPAKQTSGRQAKGRPAREKKKKKNEKKQASKQASKGRKGTGKEIHGMCERQRQKVLVSAYRKN